MVYVPEATALLLNPLAMAMASIVVVVLTVTIVQAGELAVGVVPFVVQCTTAPGVVSDNVTVCGAEYVPGAGLNVGVATVGKVMV
jgi:hypothetical protein